MLIEVNTSSCLLSVAGQDTGTAKHTVCLHSDEDARRRPGQPCIASKLDFNVNERICAHIASGLSWLDASRLRGGSRDGIRRRAKGEEQPRSAYADFLEKIEITELSLKSASIAKCNVPLDCVRGESCAINGRVNIVIASFKS